jgi:uncharacterized integral membrane protein
VAFAGDFSVRRLNRKEKIEHVNTLAEYIPAFSVLLVLLIIILAVLRKFDGVQLVEITGRANFVLAAGSFLFVVVGIIYLFKSPNWTPDLLKVLAGIIVGASATKGSSEQQRRREEAGVGIASSTFGSHAKVAGRDINEMIESMYGEVSEIRDSVINQYGQISRVLESVSLVEDQVVEYLFHTVFATDGEPLNEIAKAARELQGSGWTLLYSMPSYVQRDGIVAVFRRGRAPSQEDKPIPGTRIYLSRFYHGRRQVELDYE